MFQPKKCWWSNSVEIMVVMLLSLAAVNLWLSRRALRQVPFSGFSSDSSPFEQYIQWIHWRKNSPDIQGFTPSMGCSFFNVPLNLSWEGRFWWFFDLKPPQICILGYCWSILGLVSRHHGCWHQPWVKPEMRRSPAGDTAPAGCEARMWN